MFRSCQLALGEDEHKDEREWERRLAKSRKRQRKKKKDDALVASFFSHVQDPVAMQIAGLLLDYPIHPCAGDDDSNDYSSNNCENVGIIQQGAIMATTENKEKQYHECGQHCNWNQVESSILEEDSDDHIYFDAMDDSEPTSLHHPVMMLEADSERTVKMGSVHISQTDCVSESRNANKRKFQKNGNVKQMSPTGKENWKNQDAPSKSTKTGKQRQQQTSNLHHLSNIRRSPFHESSKSIVLTSRQQKSLALNSF